MRYRTDVTRLSAAKSVLGVDQLDVSKEPHSDEVHFWLTTFSESGRRKERGFVLTIRDLTELMSAIAST